MAERSSSGPTSTGEGEPFVVRELEQVKALTHPLRQRILERFALRPRTTKQVADELGEKPTRLYHHVATLERAGLIRLVETKPKRGTTEKYFSAVAERFEIDPRAFAGEGAKMTVQHPSVALVEGLFENTRAELADLLQQETTDSLAQEAVFVRLELRGSQETIDAARERLDALIQEIQRESVSDDEDESDETQAQRLILGWYPLKN